MGEMDWKVRSEGVDRVPAISALRSKVVTSLDTTDSPR